MAGPVAVRPVLAVAGDRAVDEPRVLLAQALVSDAEAIEHPGPERFEQHVRARATSVSSTSLPLGGLEIDPDRALAAVQRQEQRAPGARLGALVIGRRPADIVPEPGVLDLDHVRAVVGEQQRAEPAGQEPRQVEHLQPFERPARGLRRRRQAPPHSRRADPEQLARLLDRRRAPAGVLGHLPGLRDQVPVRARHRAVGEVEVVLEPDADRAAERQRRGDQHPLIAADPDHPPVVSDGPAARDLGEVVRHHARGCARSPGCRRPPPSRNPRAAGLRAAPCPPAAPASPTWPTSKHSCSGLMWSRRIASSSSMISSNGLANTNLNTKSLRRARVLGVVHRAHVERRHLRPPGLEISDPLRHRDADRAGREVDDHRVADLGPDRVADREEVLDLVARGTVGRCGRGCGCARRPRRRSGAPRPRTPRACTGSPGTGRGWRSHR